MIPFNKPYLTGKEEQYIREALETRKLCGNGPFTKKCQKFFEERYGIHKALLTTSCTDALEMCAMLIDIQPGDEVIVPSYTFVSSALAFSRQGAKIVFVDSRPDHPGMDESLVEELITPKTKAIVAVHYAGVACDMDVLLELVERRGLWLIEDAAQAIDSFYKGKPLGSIGHLGAFSFHETKNIVCGEGGMLAINYPGFANRAEILWEKGTNRSAFFKGEVDKYGWVDTGSSFLPSELNAAFLWAQLEALEDIQLKRKEVWDIYQRGLNDVTLLKKLFIFPAIPDFASNNAHMYYLICKPPIDRDLFLVELRKIGIYSVFHYQALHESFFINDLQVQFERNLPYANLYTERLIRLPLFAGMESVESDVISKFIKTAELAN